MKTYHLKTNQGNNAVNQVVIQSEDRWGHGVSTFQSYQTIMAHIDCEGTVTLDKSYPYSRTTSRYLNQFLSVTSKDRDNFVKSGAYKIADLNDLTATFHNCENDGKINNEPSSRNVWKHQ